MSVGPQLARACLIHLARVCPIEPSESVLVSPRKSNESLAVCVTEIRAVGAMLGPQMGLWAIAASALIGALIGAIWSRMRQGEGPVLLPYGAALALVAATLLTVGRL